ncbi:hypothetical protein D3C85_1276580 [compost metagenome]
MLDGVEANDDRPQILSFCRANDIRAKMSGKFRGNGHDFAEPLFVSRRLSCQQGMGDHQRHM